MAISTQDSVLAWRNIFNRCHSMKPSTQRVLQALKSFLAQQGNNPDLQVVGFDSLSASETVIADAACKLYAVVLKKAATATATYSKLTDHATTSSDDSSDFVILSNVSKSEHPLVFPQAVSFANGITMQGNTTASGGTTSGANACSGFAIIGAA